MRVSLLLFGVLILGLCVSVRCTAAPGPGEDPGALPDQVIDAAFWSDMDELDRWHGALTRHLALDVDDPWINLNAAMSLWTSAGLSPENRATIRERVRQIAWDDPATLWLLWGAQCPLLETKERAEAGARCGDPELEARLRQLEPDNAAAVVLGIDDSGDDTASLLSPRNVQQLQTAARLSRFDTWNEAGADRLHTAVAQFTAQNPPPDGSATADSSAFYSTLIAMLNTDNGIVMGTSRFSKPCRHAATIGEAAVIESCRALIRTIKGTARSEVAFALAVRLEFWLVYGLDHGYSDHGMPPGWVEASRQASDLRACRRPAFLSEEPNGFQPSNAEAQRIIDEIADLGPRRAWFRAAQRDFAAHPERYAVDPDDCENAYPLKTAGTDPNS